MTHAANAPVSVAGAPITQASILHWKKATFASTYFAMFHEAAPAGLVTDRRDDGPCIPALRAYVRRRFSSAVSLVRLKAKCRQLNELFWEDAISTLIFDRWALNEAATQGFRPTGQELDRAWAHVKQETFPTPALRKKYLRERGISEADERLVVEQEIVSGALLSKRAAQVEQDGGEGKVVERERREKARLTAATICRHGYVVPQCSEYRAAGSASAEPSGAVVVESLPRFH